MDKQRAGRVRVGARPGQLVRAGRQGGKGGRKGLENGK